MGFIQTNKKHEDLKEPVCSVGVQNILQMLHLHSEEEAYKVSKSFKIFNSAIEQRGHSLQFAGAGKHVLVFTPLVDDWEPKTLVKVAEAYVYNFTGEQIKLSYLQFNPIQKQMTPNELAKYKEKTNESASTVFTFDTSQLCSTAQVKSDLMQMLFETKVDKDDPLKSKMTDFDVEVAGQSKERVTGYFLRFNVATGEYERKTSSTPLQSAWNNVLKTAKQTLDGISISKFDWKSGSEGQKHYLGNFINSILGKIDAEKLRSSVSDQLQLKHRGMMAHVDIMSSGELANFLRKRLARDDIDKIQKAEYTLGIKINKAEKGYEQVNVPYIANVVNKSIEKSVINKLTGVNNITDDDVILINHYDDNLRDTYYNKYSKTYHEYTNAELYDNHTDDYVRQRSLLAKVLMFKYYKNRIDVFSTCQTGYDIKGPYSFTKPADIDRIRNASYNISLSGISSLVGDLQHRDHSIIENQISRNPSDLSDTFSRWTYQPDTTLYKVLDALTDVTSVDVLSGKVAKAFNVNATQVIGTGSNDITPIAAKLSGDTLNSRLLPDVCNLIDQMKNDVKTQSDVEYNKDKAKSHRTEYDVYLVPLENLEVKSASPKTRPDIEQK